MFLFCEERICERQWWSHGVSCFDCPSEPGETLQFQLSAHTTDSIGFDVSILYSNKLQVHIVRTGVWLVQKTSHTKKSPTGHAVRNVNKRHAKKKQFYCL